MQKTEEIVWTMADLAKKASYKLSTLSTEEKNAGLKAIASGLFEHRSHILAENAIDVRQAHENKMPNPMIDRLMLDERRLNEMIEGVNLVASLGDPVGKLITSKTLDNNLELRKVRVPIGVIG